jgi:hypothetical protein
MRHEGRKQLGFDVAEVKVIGNCALTAGNAYREPTGTDSKVRLALDKGAEGIGSGEFRHDDHLRN